MLVLQRKVEQSLIFKVTVGGEIVMIKVKVTDIRGSATRLGIEAPACVQVLREEILDVHQPAAPAAAE